MLPVIITTEYAKVIRLRLLELVMVRNSSMNLGKHRKPYVATFWMVQQLERHNAIGFTIVGIMCIMTHPLLREEVKLQIIPHLSMTTTSATKHLIICIYLILSAQILCIQWNLSTLNANGKWKSVQCMQVFNVSRFWIFGGQVKYKQDQG